MNSQNLPRKERGQCSVQCCSHSWSWMFLCWCNPPNHLCVWEHIQRDSLPKLFTPLALKTEQTRNLPCLQYPVLSMPFILGLTDPMLTGQCPVTGTTLGGGGSGYSRQPCLLSSTLTFISVFTLVRFSALRKMRQDLKSRTTEGALNYLGMSGWSSGSFTTAACLGQYAGRSAREQRDSRQTYINTGRGCSSQVWEVSPETKQILLPKKSNSF